MPCSFLMRGALVCSFLTLGALVSIRQSIRKTYEQIVKRLKEERVGFDNQLAAIERTLKAKEKDLEELVLMSHDAQHAKEVSI